jgi:plasmid stabilization system protein ParE
VTDLDLIIHETARHDVDGHTEYLDDQDPDMAERFHSELAHVFERLTTFPAFGQLWPSPNPAHRDLRRAVLPTLPFSVFYRPTRTTIEVVRVLHHAQDIPPLRDEM